MDQLKHKVSKKDTKGTFAIKAEDLNLEEVTQ